MILLEVPRNYPITLTCASKGVESTRFSFFARHIGRLEKHVESRRVTEIRQQAKPKNLPPRTAFGSFMKGVVALGRRTEMFEGVTLTPEDFPDHTVYSAFRFLDLLTTEGRATGRFIRLLAQKIGGADWRTTLREVTTHCYAFVFHHLSKADLTDVAPRRLLEAFDPVSPTKGSVEQCAEFFRKLCWACGIPVRLTPTEQTRQDQLENAGKDYPAVLAEFIDAQIPEAEEKPAAPVEESQGFVRLQEAVAEVLELIGDESNYDLVVETLREALPEKTPAPLPDLPPFDKTWDAPCRARWFEIYALKMKCASGAPE